MKTILSNKGVVSRNLFSSLHIYCVSFKQIDDHCLESAEHICCPMRVLSDEYVAIAASSIVNSFRLVYHWECHDSSGATMVREKL
jgi:hypothetical protein